MNPQANLLEHVAMERQTAWRAGGLARFGYAPSSEEELSSFLKCKSRPDLPLFFVGLGSNLLIRDGGLEALVVFTHRGLSDMYVAERNKDTLFYASAGVALPKLARFSANMGFEGAEFMAGIPGSVGGGLAMNAGCYGSEVWDCVARVRTITSDGEIKERSPADYVIEYRNVSQKHQQREFFVGGWFRFNPGDKKKSRNKIKELLKRRVREQPLSRPNSGSVFRNPEGEFAARLIERSGLKGLQRGAALVSDKHANFIINTGGATAKNIEDLILEVQSVVELNSGVKLKREVHIMGDHC
ncbi:UDP-N-acetylmuramate dehydrogenase [Burkholderiales bacterium]|nr:UDP-N-acetylmuramate dehydrogenase [Burkholderiales bacterium]